MDNASRTEEPQTLARIRRLLLVALGGGAIGTSAELLLLGHFESALQWLPLAALALAAGVLAWHAVRPRRASVRALQVAMVLLMACGAVGMGLHYDGNAEFELEMYPSMVGVELIQKTLTGATPVLAPGSMALLGLIGLAHTYRHPCLDSRTDDGIQSGR